MKPRNRIIAAVAITALTATATRECLSIMAERRSIREELGTLHARCEGIRRGGSVERELGRWPQPVADAIPAVSLVPRAVSDSILRRMPEPEAAYLRKLQSLEGRISFKDDGRVASFEITYDQRILNSAVDHEVGHYLWERMGCDDRKRAAQALDRTTPSATSELVFEGYLFDTFSVFMKSSMEIEGRLIRAFFDSHDKVKERMDAIDDSGGESMDARTLRSCAVVLVRTGNLLMAWNESTKALDAEIDKPDPSVDFKGYVDSTMGNIDGVLGGLREFKRLIGSLGSEVSVPELPLEELASLRAQLNGIYENELFARGIERIAENPKNPADAPLVSVLRSVEIKGARVFAGLIGDSFEPARKMPPINCLP